MSTETLNQSAVTAPQATGNAYELLAVGRTYATEAGGIDAVKNIDLVIGRGEYVVIEGPSGSGKSTLLQLMGMLDQPTKGRIKCGGSEVSELSESELAEMRLNKVGFIFQQFNLIPTLTAAQNVEIAMFPTALTKSEAKQRAINLLDQVGLADRADHHPSQLSGGEQQRVAIARALANEPEILLADEPTGNLDTATSSEILEVVRGLWAEGLTVIVITHDHSIAEAAPRTFTMRDGEMVTVP
ncbi:MAG: ABC transporter ATP-binding protein [Solirubrobacterales bacterium]|nr:ABC transporter ATP-binding protein [Solirubrobacterales bacterium]